MADSSIWFYRVGWDVSENAYIDDLEDYLSSLDSWYDILGTQYIRHALNLTIKINVSQLYANNWNYNYCKIYNNDDGFNVYYFINNVKQTAQSTLTLELTMDTVNSVGQTGFNPYNFTDRTEIQREHEDRFKKRTITEGTTTVVRNVDRVSEGIVPDKVKISDNEIINSDGKDLDWYLVYRSTVPTDDNPVTVVTVGLVASEPLKIEDARTGPRTITGNSLLGGHFYYFTDVDNENGEFTLAGDNTLYRLGITTQNKCENANLQVTKEIECTVRGLMLYRTALNKIGYNIIYDHSHIISTADDNVSSTSSIASTAKSDSIGEALRYISKHKGVVDSVTINVGNFFRDSALIDYTRLATPQLQPEGIAEKVRTKLNIRAGTSEALCTLSIDDIDRTDSTLVKILKLPYCPIEHTISDGKVIFDENWQYDYDSGMLTYQGDNLPNVGVDSISNVTIYDMLRTTGARTKTDNKDINNESKLYHSDFFTDKYVYDSFSQELKRENMDVKNTTATAPTVEIGFKPTNTINSKLGFSFNWTDSNNTFKDTEDFSRILLATRNNEETILNSEYLNYIKYGYEYDKKQNSLQIENAQRNAGVSTAGTAVTLLAGLASLLASPATGGISGAAGIGLLSSAVSGAITTGNQWAQISNTEAQQQNAMQQKLAQLASQSVNTSGTDDVDIMSWYSGNRLHRMQYQPSELVRNKLWNLFFNTGYAHPTIAKPKVDTRIWFNYIQCNPQFYKTNSGKFKDEWLKDMRDRYAQGVTVYHHNEIDGEDVYDFTRHYENWETWFFEEEE